MTDFITEDTLIIALIGSLILWSSLVILFSVAIAGSKRIPRQPATRFDCPTKPQ